MMLKVFDIDVDFTFWYGFKITMSLQVFIIKNNNLKFGFDLNILSENNKNIIYLVVDIFPGSGIIIF